MLMPLQLLPETLVLSGLRPDISPKSQINKSGIMPISDAAFAKKLMRSIVVAAVVRDNQKSARMERVGSCSEQAF